MKTVWLCQDDEATYDMLQLYREARSRCRKPAGFLVSHQWAAAHDVMFDLEDQAGDLP